MSDKKTDKISKPSWRAEPNAYKTWNDAVKKKIKPTIQRSQIIDLGKTKLKKPSWRAEPEAYKKWKAANE
tara:strand:- start:59 stop:268 length:210 start_codon:yes stop_codon:yes gene_type:complete